MKNDDLTYKISKENLSATFSFGQVKKSTKNPWISKPHFHSSIELQYILNGNATITTTNQTKAINAGCFCIIPPKTEHFILASKDTETEKFAMRIDFVNTRKEHEFDFYKYVTSIFGNMSQATIIHDHETQSHFEKLIKLSCETNQINKIQISAFLMLILISLCEAIKDTDIFTNKPRQTNFSNKTHMYSAKIEAYIVRNYDKKISLKMLSHELSLSNRQCERIIKEYFNMDFRTLLLKQRMVIAKQLINERAYSLEAISEKCGYSSYAGFYKAFKQYYKASPNKFHTIV